MTIHIPEVVKSARNRTCLPQADMGRTTLEQVVEANADAIVVVGADQRILYTNPAAETLFGRSREELVGGPFGLPLVPGDRTELNIVRSEGCELIAEMRAVEIDWLGKHAYVVSLRDISPRKQLEDELRQAHKMEALGNLAGGIAHEFNNLLTAILFNSGCLVERMPEDDRLYKYAAQVRSVANRAAALTGQLLTFSRKRHVMPGLYDLNEVVTDMTTLMSQILGKRIRLKTSTSRRPALVLIDRGQFEQVIINLAVNARDAMPEGGDLEYIIETIDADEAGPAVADEPTRYVSMVVRDTGCGMSEEVQARAFEPFFTTKDESHGTGLGLATTHGIIHQAGGRIVLQSTEGEGTVFRVMLPYRGSLETGLQQSARQTGRRILVVDDDQDVCDVMTDLLREHDYEVQFAYDSTQALQILHRSEERFDLVITDLVMPGGSGCQLADDLRQLCDGLPILFVSGHARDGLPERFQSDPNSAFVEKPFSSTEFMLTVERLLGDPGAIDSHSMSA